MDISAAERIQNQYVTTTPGEMCGDEMTDLIYVQQAIDFGWHTGDECKNLVEFTLKGPVCVPPFLWWLDQMKTKRMLEVEVLLVRHTTVLAIYSN